MRGGQSLQFQYICNSSIPGSQASNVQFLQQIYRNDLPINSDSHVDNDILLKYKIERIIHG